MVNGESHCSDSKDFQELNTGIPLVHKKMSVTYLCEIFILLKEYMGKYSPVASRKEVAESST